VLAEVAGDERRALAPGVAAQGIRVPTLLLWCSEDQVIDPSSAAEFAQRVRHAQRVLIADCGHMPMMEKPAETAQALLDFLRAP